MLPQEYLPRGSSDAPNAIRIKPPDNRQENGPLID